MICLPVFALHIPTVHAQDPVPTPTDYDPLAQPDLPAHPTDLELGKYLFWRHCMPCHGDIGQGLTDEFRVLWEDHQNCWDRGCHGGKRDDEGFPIPKIVPAIVTNDGLSQFASEEELYKFLKATHPPQYPGFLEDNEYRLLSVYVFKLNNREADQFNTSPTTSATALPTFIATQNKLLSKQETRSVGIQLIAGLGILVFVLLIVWIKKKAGRQAN